MRAYLGWLALCVVGCAATSFQPSFQKVAAPTESALHAALTRDKLRDERPVAVGITMDPERLFAWDLSAGLLWERPVQAKSAPLVVADAIVMQEAQGIVVRDLASGEPRAIVDEKGHLIGADGVGHSVVVAIGYEGAAPRAAVAYVEGDSVRWKQELNLPVGTPALVDGYVLVPWATQRLSALAARDGRELGRWEFPHEVIGHALVDRGRVFVGQHGLSRLTEATLAHTDPASPRYTPFKRSLPSQPPLLRDGYLPVPEPKSAYHQLRLDWRVGASEAPMAAENDLLVLRFYRLLFGLDAREDAVRWVRTFDHDLVGVAVQPGGLFVADSAGTLLFLDASGVTRMQRDTGRAVEVLTIRPGAWVPTYAADAKQAGPDPLREQLFTAASLPDDRLGAGRAYAVEHITRDQDPAVTVRLIALCGDRKSTLELQAAACTGLAKRESGGEDVTRALSSHASFLASVDGPPVGPLAQAAAQMQLKAAGPLLVAHVEDPSTPARDLVPVLEAIERLGHRRAGAAIERFVRLHHAEPADSELAPALYAALHTLGSLRVRSARPTLADAAQDELAPAATRDKAREALTLLDAPTTPRPAPATAKAADKSEAEPADETEEEPSDSRPFALSQAIVGEALRPVAKALSQCLLTDPSNPKSARLSLVVGGDGRVEIVFVLPSTLQGCIEGPVLEAKFPATRSGRQSLTHAIYPPRVTEKEKAKPDKKKPAAPRKPAASKAP